MTPYRTDDQPPRFICIVCYETVSSVEGRCARCSDSPLQDINQEVLAELRARAKLKMARPEMRRTVFVVVSALVCAALLHGALLGFGVYDEKPIAHSYSIRAGTGGILALYFFLTWLFLVGVFFYLARWLQLFPEMKFDPATADVRALLGFLGLLDAANAPGAKDSE